MNNILVTGGNGQLSSELKEITPNFPDYNFLFTDVSDLDITETEDTKIDTKNEEKKND